MQANRHQPSAECVRDIHQAPSSGSSSRVSIASAIFALFFVVGSAHAKGPGTPTAEHLGLTPAYLQGDWCQTYIQFPNKRADENVPFRWDPDGTYAGIVHPAKEMQPGLVYRYKPDGKVTLAYFPGLLLKVKSVKPDAFVLQLSGDLHFRRGTCK